MRPVLAAVLLSCSEAETAKPPPPVPTTLAEYLAADLSFGCTAFVCTFGIAPSESVAFCGDEPEKRANREKAVAAGRLVFDAGKAKACVAGLAAFDPANCWGAGATSLDEEIRRAEVACEGTLVGAAALGATCFADEECADGWCDESASVCPGTCQPLRSAGESCKEALCAAGLVCAANVCTSPAVATEACTAAKPCRAGLRCFSGVCAPPRAEGEACEPAKSDCAAGLFCDVDTCRPKLTAGAECRVGSRTLSIASAACAGNQVCLGLVTGDDDEVLIAGHCGTPFDVGGACTPTGGNPGFSTDNTGCFLGIGCSDAEKCVSYPGAGAACLDGECNQQAYCREGQCAALKADGESCNGNSECLHACLSATHKCGPATAASRCLAP